MGHPVVGKNLKSHKENVELKWSLEAVAVGYDLADDHETVLSRELVGHVPAQREARGPVMVRLA